MFPRRGVGMARRRPLLRAAVVGGGAYMAGKSAARRQEATAQQEAGQDERIGNLEQQQAPPSVPEQRQEGSPTMGDLDRLTALHEQGALTDQEFSAAKAKLLGL
jgi:hypothetical protein